MASFGLSRQSIQLHLDETFKRLEELDAANQKLAGEKRELESQTRQLAAEKAALESQNEKNEVALRSLQTRFDELKEANRISAQMLESFQRQQDDRLNREADEAATAAAARVEAARQQAQRDANSRVDAAREAADRVLAGTSATPHVLTYADKFAMLNIKKDALCCMDWGSNTYSFVFARDWPHATTEDLLHLQTVVTFGNQPGFVTVPFNSLQEGGGVTVTTKDNALYQCSKVFSQDNIYKLFCSDSKLMDERNAMMVICQGEYANKVKMSSLQALLTVEGVSKTHLMLPEKRVTASQLHDKWVKSLFTDPGVVAGASDLAGLASASRKRARPSAVSAGSAGSSSGASHSGSASSSVPLSDSRSESYSSEGHDDSGSESGEDMDYGYEFLG